VRVCGELEARIMRILWGRDRGATVREVHDELNLEGPLAYTTVMTVMDRLRRKGILQRRGRGRAFEYLPASSEAEYTASLMHEVLSRTRDRKTVLAHFVRGMKKSDEAELLRLAEAAARRKRNA